jgi:pimeloyl-ACP methyl ester carboxylesterase
MRFEKVFLAGDGLTLCADAMGDAKSIAVLFFHGGGQSRRSWRGAALRIAQAGYRALTFDLRGHGESDWAGDGDYLLDAFGRDVERLLGAFDRPVVLVGASRGGQAALVGGSRQPDKIRMVMLADVAPIIADAGVEPLRAFFQHSLPGFASVDDAADALSDFLGKPRLANVAGLAKAMRKDSTGRLYWNWDPKMVAPEFINPLSESEAIEAAAARIECPVVLVRAEHSEIVSEDSVRRFIELKPNLIVLEAKGVGHMFTGDQNDAFADSLLEYLGRFAPLPD